MKKLLLALLLITPSAFSAEYWEMFLNKPVSWNIFLSSFNNSILTVSETTALYDAVSDTYLTPQQIQDVIESGKDVVLSNCTKDDVLTGSCDDVIAHVIDSIKADCTSADTDLHGYLAKDK